MKHKPGDNVSVLPKLKPGKKYKMENSKSADAFDYVMPEMLKYSGKTVTIKTACAYGYTIEDDPCNWCWTDEMFVS